MSARHAIETLATAYERDLQRELVRQHPHLARAIEPRELTALPTPVRNFVVASGMSHYTHASNARVVWRAMQLRSSPAASWLHVECEQVSFFREPARLALMRSMLGGVLPFSGYDRYQDARARMFVNVAGALPLRRAHGRHLDASALLTYVSEAMLLPVLFVDPHVQWTPLDEHSAHATMHHAGSGVGGVFSFGPANEWARFETDDRWRDGRVPTRQRWSAEVSAFAWRKGLRLPGEATARWHGSHEAFTYMRGSIESVSYDITDARAMVDPHWFSRACGDWRKVCSRSGRAHDAPGGSDDVQEDTGRARLLGTR